MTKGEQIYQYAKLQIGKKLSPVFGSLGCVEALRTVFKQGLNIELADTYSTYQLYLSLLADKRFLKILIPSIGDIIISPTGFGNGLFPGHCGIVGENNKIYSNDSDTLKWSDKYIIETWRERYMRKGGFPVLFYRYIDKEPVKIEPPLKPQNLAKDNAIIEQLKVVLEKIASILRELLK